MPIATPALPPHVAEAPAAFVQNAGQSKGDVIYESSAHGYRLEIGSQGAVIRKGAQRAELQFRGARAARVTAEDEVSARFHLYLGGKRRENLPMYGRVRQQELYPGIDAVYYGTQRYAEYDFVVRPQADAGRIKMRFAGAKVKLEGDGSLRVDTGGMVWEQKAPRAFQRVGGETKAVAAGYAVAGDGEISLRLGEYDRSRELTIDPVLSPFGNIGAAGLQNSRYIAMDPQNNVYVGDSNEFKLFDEDARTVRVAKFSAAGNLVYQFQMQDGDDRHVLLRSLAAAADGSLALGGTTDSRDVPTTENAFQPRKDLASCPPFPNTVTVACVLRFGRADGFVLKLRPAGTVEWGTYLGESDRDGVNGVAFGPGGRVYAVGETLSNFFPTKNEFQGCSTLPENAFLTVIRADGTDIEYSTCLRPSFSLSSRSSLAYAVAVDAAGFAYVAGDVKAGNGEFPVRGTSGATPFQSTPAGGKDAFVAKFNPTLTGDATLVYSTLVGGASDDRLDAIALDANGQVCAAGRTQSSNYPRFVPAGSTTPLNTFRGPVDLAVTCLSANASSLVFSNLYGVQVTDLTSEYVPTAPAQRWMARDGQGRLHVTSGFTGTFTAVNGFDNATANPAGAYLQLAAGSRSVSILSHTPETVGVVTVDTAGTPFVGTTGGIRKFENLCAADVTSNVQVIQGNVIFDVATGRFRQAVSLRSLLQAPMPAGARLVFTGLLKGVNVFQPAGTTVCFAPAGAPFVVLPVLPQFGAGFATVTVEFTSTGNAVVYTPKVAGPGGGI
ncbi:MAG: hypothetical protein JNK48_33690 [Bryobacterales bacterium]|nr:hypothetical protein [Bryobacterales bacterium]